MENTSLLEKEGPITLEDLKANFRANDFSAYSSGFGDKEESDERNENFGGNSYCALCCHGYVD